MSTVKIKTEPTPATAAVNDVKVKLEPSLSTGDIKLEQHISDIDTKFEPGSEADSEVSEEDYIKSESDDDRDDDDGTDQFTITPKRQRRVICKHLGCSRSFKHAHHMRVHQHEHRLQTELGIDGKSYILTRQSLNDRWPCPVLNCKVTGKTVNVLYMHIRTSHGNVLIQQHQRPLSQSTLCKRYFHDVDDFYVGGVRCGYQTTIGVFICYECRLVSECLLTHLQQKHGYDEKLIDNSTLPESAVNANADPNTNQHTSNPHLASAIGQPYKQQHPDITQGWLCVTSDCGHCSRLATNKTRHKKRIHRGEQISTVPALMLRLVFGKSKASHFLISRIDQTGGTVTASINRVNQHKYDYGHDGLKTQDGNRDDVEQDETANGFNQKKQWICEYSDCGLLFNSSDSLSAHRRDHNLEVVIKVHGSTYTLTRQSLNDRWSCPVSDCEVTFKLISSTHKHIQHTHITSLKHKRAKSEVDDIQQQKRQQIIKKRKPIINYLKVDAFYVSGTRCGYHNPTGVFICHECKLVPECLLTHLQQKHGYDEKSINSSVLPESTRITGSDPNINQHTSNPYLASAINQPYQWRNSDIIQGWQCVESNCDYCCPTKRYWNRHNRMEHKGEQISTVPAVVLRLRFAKTQNTYFFITRLDTATNNSVESNNSVSQHNSECCDDDGDELVLSDYSDEDDIH